MLTVQDSFAQINTMKEGIKDRLPIVFVDKYGMQEAGIGPGLFKDLIENLVKEGYDPRLGLFLATSDNRLYPNPNANEHTIETALPSFEFLGKILGKTMYEVSLLQNQHLCSRCSSCPLHLVKVPLPPLF